MPPSHPQCRFMRRVRCSLSSNANASACPRLCEIMIHRNVLARRRARGAETTWKFSQWSLLFITKRHFFPFFKVCLFLPFFFFLLHISFYLFFNLISYPRKALFLFLTQNCAYITLDVKYMRRRIETGYAVLKQDLKFLVYSFRIIVITIPIIVNHS